MPMVRTILPPLALCWRPIASGTPVDTALQALLLQARLGRQRSVSAVRPHLLAGVGEIEHVVQLLTVVHGRVGHIPFADQIVRLVHVDMVLVAVEALVILLRPARVLVLLGILGRPLLPSFRRLAGLDRLVLLLRVALLGHRHDRGVDDLAASRCWPKRANSLSISPPSINAYRNSQIVVASGTGSSISRSRKRMNEKRSPIRYSVCSSERLCTDCRPPLLRFMRTPERIWPASLSR